MNWIVFIYLVLKSNDVIHLRHLAKVVHIRFLNL